MVICTGTPKPAKDVEQKIGRSGCSLAMHISICELESRLTVKKSANSGPLDTAEVSLFSLKVERVSRHALLKDYSIPTYRIYPCVSQNLLLAYGLDFFFISIKYNSLHLKQSQNQLLKD